MPDGSPVADALVTLGDLDDTDTATCSAADGTFAIDDIAFYSSVHAAALRDGALWRGKTDADGGPLDLVVTLAKAPETDTLRLVHVVGWDGGRVDAAHATVLRREVAWNQRHFDAIGVGGGWLAVQPLAIGRDGAPLLVVTAAADAEGRALPYGPVLVDAERLDGLVTEIRLPPGVSLAGRVVGPDGEAVPGARVSLVPPPPDGFDADHMPAWTEWRRTGDDGAFSFHGLPRGAGRLSVLATGPLASTAGVEVACGDADVVVRLTAAVSATITVTDAAGAPVADADVWCDDWPEKTATKTGADGRALLVGLRPGVPATLGVDRDGFVRTTRDGWVAADTTIVLAEDHPIRGVVVDAAGRPFPEAPLTALRSRSGALLRHVELADDGTFVVWDVPAGESVELCLADRGRTVARTVAIAGATGVVLVWDDPGRFAVAFPRSADDAWDGAPLVTLRDAGGRDAAVVSPEDAASRAVLTFDAAALPDRVDVQAGPLADGHWALVRGVSPRGVLRIGTEVWQHGRSLRGTVVRADGTTSAADVTVTVRDGDGFVVRTRAAPDGTFRVPGAPRTALTCVAESGAGLQSDVHAEPADMADVADVLLRLRE